MRALIEALGTEVKVERIHVETEQRAGDVGLVSSPTIRVNGRDVSPDVRESECASCGELCGQGVTCRTWTWQGESTTEPPKALLVDAIVRELYGLSTGPVAERPREIPENLKRFFAARKR